MTSPPWTAADRLAAQQRIAFDMAARDFKPGLYRHYKGGEYCALAIVRDSSNGTEDRPMVLYTSCASGRMNVRPWSEWNDRVYADRARFEFVRDEVP